MAGAQAGIPLQEVVDRDVVGRGDIATLVGDIRVERGLRLVQTVVDGRVLVVDVVCTSRLCPRRDRELRCDCHSYCRPAGDGWGGCGVGNRDIGDCEPGRAARGCQSRSGSSVGKLT